MNLSTNTCNFIVIIAHEIGFRAFAYPARRRTVSQLGIVSITCKSKSQLPHLVSIIMTEQQSKQLEQVMCQLADIVQEVDDIELTSAFDEIIIYMSNNS